MLPNVDQQQIKEMSFLLGYKFKQSEKDLLDLPFSWFRDKYDWLKDYSEKQNNSLNDNKISKPSSSMPRIRSKR